MRKLHLLAVFVALVALIFNGCLEPNSGGRASVPHFPTVVTFFGPSSPNAPQELGTYVSQFNANTALAFSYLTLARLQTPHTEGNTTTWTITSGQLVATITAVKNDDSADWTFELNGTDQGGTTYDHFQFMTGTSTMDGKSGTMHIFDASGTEIGLFEWSETDAGVKSADLTVYGSPNTRYSLVNNADHSGTLDVFEGTTKTYHAQWNTSGAGSWEKYNADGSVADSGSWS